MVVAVVAVVVVVVGILQNWKRAWVCGWVEPV